MTFTYKTEHIGRMSVSIEQEKFENTFHVRAYEEVGSQYYKRWDTVYSDEKKAMARFNRMVNEYKKRGFDKEV